MLVPMVIEQDGRVERSFDIFSCLLKNRIVYVSGVVDDTMTSLVTAQLIYLESVDSEKPIWLYINSPGGSVSAGLGIIDCMNYVKCECHTLCISLAASMGAMILSAGEKGHRFCLPHAKVMIHSPSGSYSGTSQDIEISASEMRKTRNVLNQMLVENTGNKLSQIEKAMDRDYWMSGEEAIKFGIIDNIVSKRV